MKTTLKIYLALCVTAMCSCTKEYTKNAAGTQTNLQAIVFKIGKHYGGGVIFYIDSTGQHGLIADTVDIGPSIIQWAPDSDENTLIGTTKKAIGSGYRNTKRIVNALGDSKVYAANICWKYEGNGFTDWYLPSKDELNEMYKQRQAIGGFTSNDYYWSSSEQNYARVWVQYIFFNATTNQLGDSKTDNLKLRAIRSF